MPPNGTYLEKQTCSNARMATDKMSIDEGALLEELKAISNKTSSSSRFAMGGSGDENQQEQPSVMDKAVSSSNSDGPIKIGNSNLDDESPPWKADLEAWKLCQDNKPPLSPRNENSGEIPSRLSDLAIPNILSSTNPPSTSPGDHLSSGTQTADSIISDKKSMIYPQEKMPEIQDDGNEEHDLIENLPLISPTNKSRGGSKCSPGRSSIMGSNYDDESQISHAESGNDFLTSLPDMFDRGRAEYSDDDEQLLEELRAISTKSSSEGGSTFDEDDFEGENPPNADPPPSTEILNSKKLFEDLEVISDNRSVQKNNVDDTSTQESNNTITDLNYKPPSSKEKRDPKWKSMKKKMFRGKDEKKDEPPESEPPGFETSLPKTFKGDHGGSAMDKELLEELKAISAKSNSGNRFGEDQDVEENVTPEQPIETLKAKRPKTPLRMVKKLIPWKRKSTKANDNETDSLDSLDKIEKGPPKTFTGNNGGSAVDDGLLEELRAISSKSSSADRFQDDATESFPLDQSTIPSASLSAEERDVNELPPWKQKVNKKDMTKVDVKIEADNITKIESKESQNGFQSSQSNTFNGDRGGSAEDDALLAELRAISSKSSSARFQENENSAAGDGSYPTGSTNEKNSVTANSMPTEPLSPPEMLRKADASAPAMKTVELPSIANSFDNEDNPKTFTGDRGGNANDDDLLAELRAISAKSSSGDRFQGDDSDTITSTKYDTVVPRQSSGGASTMRCVSSSLLVHKKGDEDNLPPWKQKKNKNANKANQFNNEDHFQNSLPKTFKGDRGGSANDDGLLAELRAISSKSSSADRFQEDESDTAMGASTMPNASSSLSAQKQDDNEDNLPPWKQKGGKAKAKEAIQNSLPKTFKGDRGGSANDDELLAELRAISSKSSSADRFQEDESGTAMSGEDGVGVPQSMVPPNDTSDIANVSSLSAQKQDTPNGEDNLPPWKRKSRKPIKHPDTNINSTPLTKPPRSGNGFESSQPKTFKGDRGGSAEDDDLLAELRAISSKSSSADRFQEAESEDNLSSFQSLEQPLEAPPLSHPKRDEGKLPPWKHKGGNAKSRNAEIDATPPTEPKQLSGQSLPRSSIDGFQSSQPKTFKGDRGGSAEDDDLLAELRAISAQSNSSNRFQDEESEDNATLNQPIAQPKKAPSSPPQPKKAPSLRTKLDINSPRKVASSKPQNTKIDTNSQTESEPLSKNGDGFQSSQPKTFKGDRGGSAEDDDLLAELRAISAKSNNRFQEDRNEVEVNIENNLVCTNASPANHVETLPSRKQDNTKAKALAGDIIDDKGNSNLLNSAEGTSNTTPIPDTTVGTVEGEFVVTKENCVEALSSKKWKERKAAYERLMVLLAERVDGEKCRNELNASSILPSLDHIVIGIVKESNISALDVALTFMIGYSDHCSEASEADHAGNICASLLKGPALSARPVTMKLAKSLLIKMMEVGREGCRSVHSVVDLLLTNGLTSKKPKVVLNSIDLVLEASQAFGAAALPLATVSSNAIKIFSHTTGAVRATGVKIIAELCRALGSKDPLENIISSMKPSQVSDLDAMLKEQSQPSNPTVGLRSQGESSSASSLPPSEMEGILKAASEQDKAKKLASRIATDVLSEIRQTDYGAKMKLPKWSEKVGALDILIKCGGEKPYKLCQPSASVDYNLVIQNLKQCLDHTHFAVKSKSMTALGMLAEGVGERLFHHLKPLLCTILELSRDKKVMKSSQICLDSFFGNVIGFEHLLGAEDSINSAMDKKSHPLVRKGALEFLRRCIERSVTAGPCGSINVSAAQSIAKLCCNQLNDQDAGVRKEACDVLKVLLNYDDTRIRSATEQHTHSLEKTNPRVYKTLLKSVDDATVDAASPSRKKSSLPKATNAKRAVKNSPGGRQGAGRISKPPISKAKSTISLKQNNPSVEFVVQVNDGNLPSVEESEEFLSKLGIPNWYVAEDEGGILSGLKSTNWKFRKVAIDGLATFSRTKEAIAADPSYTSHVLVLVKTYTKNFKESNFNLAKAIMEIFISVCDLCLSAKRPIEVWICNSAVTLAVGKIADKKLAAIASKLLTSLCEVQAPEIIVTLSIKEVTSIKSPLPHAGLLTWTKVFCEDFGAVVLGKSISNVLKWALTECGGSNANIRKAALSLIGDLHIQLGPVIKALVMTDGSLEASTKTQVESTLDSSPFDSAAAKVGRQMKSIVVGEASNGNSGECASSLVIDIPKTDLVASLPPKCLTRMATKEGKTAWKIRKEALDEVESACLKCGGLISTAPNCMKNLIELCRALKERLGDLQSNLKPLAARNIAHILASIESSSQGKLGKIVCGPLINAAMNDNKKLMRDAAMDALEKSTTKLDIEGGGVNPSAMESYMSALVAELADSEFKAAGLPCVLEFTAGKAEYFPSSNSVSSSKGKILETNFAAMAVGCLTSSKADTRSAAEGLMKECMNFGIVSPQSIEKGVIKLKQAEQRNIRPILRSLGIDGSQKGVTVKVNDDSRRSTPARRSSAVRTRGKDRKSSGITGARPRAIASGGRESHGGFRQDEDSSSLPLNDLINDPSFLPLISNNGLTSTKAQRLSVSSRKRDHWPDYPEEPSGNDMLNTLKKIWSPILPSQSISILFPSSGIVRQEDASTGCELLSHALTLLQANGEENILIDQLDLVNKWVAFAICSRESTVGMQSLISFLLKLFSIMRHIKYQMTDAESAMILPYLLEKAGAAKGRFREMLHSLLSTLASDEIYPSTKYGSVTCTSVIERSNTAKTRALATRECHRCVEKCGLSGIGKKGVQLVAKCLSEENISENRVAFLDLIEITIRKMNGDLQKYIKICGTSNLSGKGRELVEERWSKHGSLPPPEASRRSSLTPVLRASRSSRQSLSALDGINASDRSISRSRLAQSESASDKSNMRNELPSLNLKIGNYEKNTDAAVKNALHDDNEGPFKFSFNTPDSSSVLLQRKNVSDVFDASLVGDMSNTIQDGLVSKREVTSGAAASLRERLRQIRDKHRSVTEDGGKNIPCPPSKNDPSLIDETIVKRSPPPSAIKNNVFDSIMKDVDNLLAQPTPLGDNENFSSIALSGLRRIHGSLSLNGASQNADMEPVVLRELRSIVKENLPLCVERLASVLDFGFRCGTASNPDGLSIPLLSVAIAALMAIFLDSILSALIPEEVLVLVIHRATSALLDRRLAGNSKRKNHGLDANTSKKMVKAINKLAIQATYGAKRHVSLQALLSLQLQFCLDAIQDGIAITDGTNIHNRMSRIITKLFSRVIKAEEGVLMPFSGKDVDLSSLLGSLEKVLSKTRSMVGPNGNNSDTGGAIDSDFICDNRMTPLLTMGRTLMIHLLKSKGGPRKFEEVKGIINGLNLPEDSLTGRLFSSCCSELGLEKKQGSPQKQSVSNGDRNRSYDEDKLSELIFAVGRAEEEEARMYAFDDLRDYIRQHEQVNIESHLSTLSAPFRKYILDELQNPSPFRPPLSTSSRSLMSGISGPNIPPNFSASVNPMETVPEWNSKNTNQSMSEKLRYLKSKINAAEATAQSVMESTQSTPAEFDDNSTLASYYSSGTTLTNASIFRGGEQQQTNGYVSLRERLAAANAKRVVDKSRPTTGSAPGSAFESAALGNAAALRARLESVRRMNSMSGL